MRLGVAAAVVDGAVVRGDVSIEDGRVAEVGLASGGRGFAVPGFVDLQVNGYAGVDLLTAGAEEMVEMGGALLRAGVTAYQPTLITAPPDLTRQALRELEAAQTLGGPEILGAHLEGPFLSPAKPGAHPVEWLRTPDVDLLTLLLGAGCPVTTVTIAPELPGAALLIDELVAREIRVSLGHSNATAPEAHAAFDQGASTVTHLFNAMRPFAHRDPGIVGAALARPDVVVQLIADGVHVAAEALLAAWRAARGRFAIVSDAIVAAELGDGDFQLGTLVAHVEQGVSRLDDGTLAGAVRPLNWGVRLLAELGVPIAAAVEAATRTPARVVGRPDLGRLEPGSPADLVVLDDDLAVQRVLQRGEPID